MSSRNAQWLSIPLQRVVCNWTKMTALHTSRAMFVNLRSESQRRRHLTDAGTNQGTRYGPLAILTGSDKNSERSVSSFFVYVELARQEQDRALIDQMPGRAAREATKLPTRMLVADFGAGI
jgi:hypothetical protein